MRQFIFPLLLVYLTATISACGPKVIKSTPTKRRVEVPATQVPAKLIPKDLQVLPTQRPYKINGKTYYPIPSSHGYSETGIASWYGSKFHGRKTSNGEFYNMYSWTAAHKILPMNTYLLVRNLENGREAIVRINDRGPFVKGRIIDLSYNAARKLWMIKNGTARVEIIALAETAKHRQGNKITERFLPHQNFESGIFFVQIGSFENQSNANRLKKQMTTWGKKAVIQRYARGGKTTYRVRVWAGKTLTDARRIERVLSEAGFPEAFVVAE